MIKAYRNYKAWWFQYQAPTNGSTSALRDDNEEAFEGHINSMSLYELMDTLDTWETWGDSDDQ